MRASARVAEKRTDFVCSFRRKNVLELAGLLFDFRLAVHGQSVGKKTLGKAVAADDVGSALSSARRKLYDHAAVSGGNARGF